VEARERGMVFEAGPWKLDRIGDDAPLLRTVDAAIAKSRLRPGPHPLLHLPGAGGVAFCTLQRDPTNQALHTFPYSVLASPL
jgi:hypothetical protein